jgi:hypothetical protein
MNHESNITVVEFSEDLWRAYQQVAPSTATQGA